MQAPMLPTETYLVERVRTSQTAKERRAVTGAMARKTPKAVSTPLPPRNPAKQVKLCPRIARIPQTRGNQKKSEPPFAFDASFIQMAMVGAKNPFSKSTMTTGSAGLTPNTRNVFVSPEFLEPKSRMS